MNMNKTKISLLCMLLAGISLITWAQEAPVMGKLGPVVGTELMIEGTFKAGKNSWVLVTKVNGKDLPEPKLISTCNLDPFTKIPTNTICRFKGVEITYVIKSIVDPKTGQECQQAASGRHFDFQVTEVLAPEGMKIREKKSPNKASEAIGTEAVPQPQR